MMDYRKLPNENEEQYIWRLGQAKGNGTLDKDWSEIAQIINEQCRLDETEYRTEAAYRKPYQMAKKFYEAGVFNNYADCDSYISELANAKEELAKEKVKLSDERTEWNRKLRTQARNEADLEYLEKLIKQRGFHNLSAYSSCNIHTAGDNDLVICVSDLHIGETVNNYFGEYSSGIAAIRLRQYLDEIKQIAETHKSQNAYVLILGDQVSGNIHFTTQLENRENVVEQVQTCAELLSDFVHNLRFMFERVYVNGVAGNHSRLSFKDQVVRGERLDNLIPWYMKASLSHCDNVEFLDEVNYDSTIAAFEIRGHNYWAVHGDFDKFNEKGISKLVLMLGYKPTAIFYGHLHHNSYDDIADVKIVRSGNFAGTGNDFCVSKRINGKPSQMVAVVNKDGIAALYPVDLSRQ